MKYIFTVYDKSFDFSDTQTCYDFQDNGFYLDVKDGIIYVSSFMGFGNFEDEEVENLHQLLKLVEENELYAIEYCKFNRGNDNILKEIKNLKELIKQNIEWGKKRNAKLIRQKLANLYESLSVNDLDLKKLWRVKAEISNLLDEILGDE